MGQQETPKFLILRGLNWVQGRDLNPRPSGYEGERKVLEGNGIGWFSGKTLVGVWEV